MTEEKDKKFELHVSEKKEVKPGKVVGVCPACKTKIRANTPIVLTQYLISTPQGVQPAIPKVACLSCGCEYFATAELEHLKKKIAEGQSRIILAPPGSVVPRPN